MIPHQPSCACEHCIASRGDHEHQVQCGQCGKEIDPKDVQYITGGRVRCASCFQRCQEEGW